MVAAAVVVFIIICWYNGSSWLGNPVGKVGTDTSDVNPEPARSDQITFMKA